MRTAPERGNMMTMKRKLLAVGVIVAIAVVACVWIIIAGGAP